MGLPEIRSFKSTINMERTKSIFTTAAGLQAILNNEFRNSIQRSVLFYIEGRKDSDMISPSEREMIAENAWVHVLEKREKYNATKGAKFRTWATKVATNFAKDKCNELRRDALHLQGSLEKTEYDLSVHNGVHVHHNAFGRMEDSSARQYWKDALESLENIVSSYGGRDRVVAQMLISERTKEEMMAETQMTSGNVDVCISRVRKKMRADLLEAGYSLTA